LTTTSQPWPLYAASVASATFPLAFVYHAGVFRATTHRNHTSTQ